MYCMGIKFSGLDKLVKFKEGNYLISYKNNYDDKKFIRRFKFNKPWALDDLPKVDQAEIIERNTSAFSPF
jgi:hypothetical protein